MESTPAESEQWKFYWLECDSKLRSIPFPAVLTAPSSWENFTPDITGLLKLNWRASGVDNDLVRFEVYLDQEDATTLNTTV